MRIASLRDRILVGALLVGGALSLTGCPLIPEINEKIIELVAGGSTTVSFEALGTLNVHDDTETVDISADFDLQQVLDDAGIDVSDVTDVSVSGVSYRVTKVDPEPNRQITNGNVTVARGGGAEQAIITNFDVMVNAATNWETAPVSAAGITLMNQLLDDLLLEAQTGVPASNTAITYHVTGNSLPGNIGTDFVWEIKVDVNVVGTVTIDVVE
jgi:hypothetical protein